MLIFGYEDPNFEMLRLVEVFNQTRSISGIPQPMGITGWQLPAPDCDSCRMAGLLTVRVKYRPWVSIAYTTHDSAGYVLGYT